MAGFEDLIRGALEKQGDPSPQTRASIYHSSRQALERMLGQNTTLDANAVAAQRERLEKAIAAIEKSYAGPTSVTPPVAPPAAPPPQPQNSSPPKAPASAQPAAPVAPPQRQALANPPPARPVQSPPSPPPSQSVAPEAVRSVKPASPPIAPPPAPAARSVRTEPAFDDFSVGANPATESRAVGNGEPIAPQNQPQVYRGNALRERKPYAKLFLWTVILVGLGVSVWWAINFGPDYIKQKLGGSVPNPAQTIESGSFLPPAGEGWVTVFNPAEDSANIDSSDRGTADLFQDGERNFIRLASNAGSSGNNVRIKVPRGVMLPLKGQAATFEVLLKNNSETSQQFAIFCEFGDMGTCGRKRFRANDRIEAFIFDVLVNDTTLPENQDAYISINTDLGGNGKAVDVFSIRVRSGG